MNAFGPEPATMPPDEFCIIADCGHEVYAGELLFDWAEYDKTGSQKIIHICPDCFDDKLNNFTREEKAKLLGLDYKMVISPKTSIGGKKDGNYQP